MRNLIICFLFGHDWMTISRRSYGDILRCHRCLADHIEWSHEFTERYG